ncbi:DNA polymerase/3'-5' exonuclease PolX [bacterium]|nr:DNA polymerase/3'-5' exonuclease PolX [bacterium]
MPPSERLNNQQVADIFHRIGDLLQILGDNRFKIIAYQNAARTIENLSQDIRAIHEAGTLRDLPDVGQAIAEKIAELLDSGNIAYYDELAEQVPHGVVDILAVPDVGPKTAARLWKELDIVGIDQLKAAAEEGRIRALKGFGAKSEEKILRGIELLSKRQEGRMPIGQARPLAVELIADLQERLPAGAIERIEAAGSLRRWRETIGDLDLLVVSEQPAAVMDAFRTLPQAVDVINAGDTKSTIALPSGLQVDLRVVERKHWGAALCYFTGSQRHNIDLRELAQKQGWSLNEYRLAAQGHPDLPDGEERFFDSEEELYNFLGLDWVPPEMREGQGEIAAAREHKLPDLITVDHIVGEIHGHTDWSDGQATLVEMAEAARRRGYRYWCVTDHSAGLGVTGGLDGERLHAQAKEIAALNEKYAADGVDFRLLRGTEVEILADGSLGLPDDVLAELDIVVASIHSALRQDRDTITERCLKAVRNPHVDVLGHPTGRLIGRREGSEIDMDAVLHACVEVGTVVEINAHPSRLDLSGVHARRAMELGCKLAINSDAHAADGMEILPYGIATARRGWLRSQDVINTRPLNEMLALLKK